LGCVERAGVGGESTRMDKVGSPIRA
jgi:hypothetical protein